MDLESIFSWENATKKEPLQEMLDYYEKQDYPPDIYGQVTRREGYYASRIRGFFALRLDDVICGGYCTVGDGEMVSIISVKNFLTSVPKLKDIDDVKILKSKDDGITDMRSLLLKIQEKNPLLMKSRARDMIAVKSFLADMRCVYIKPGRRRRE